MYLIRSDSEMFGEYRKYHETTLHSRENRLELVGETVKLSVILLRKMSVTETWPMYSFTIWIVRRYENVSRQNRKYVRLSKYES